RLLHEGVLAGVQGLPRERKMRENGGGDEDRVELGVFEQVLIASRPLGGRVAATVLVQALFILVAQPAQLNVLLVEDYAGKVWAPVAEPNNTYLEAFHCLQ